MEADADGMGELTMTGLDLLKQEMLKRGATKAQVESKILPMVLDIISEDDKGGAYKRLDEVEKKIKEKELRFREMDWDRNRARAEAERIIEDAKEQWKEINGYISEFYEALKNCETPEGRDAMRRAQTYKNSVIIKNGYDRTAYNILLGNILSAGDMGGLNAVKKINPTLVKHFVTDYSVLGEDAPKPTEPESDDDEFYQRWKDERWKGAKRI